MSSVVREVIWFHSAAKFSELEDRTSRAAGLHSSSAPGRITTNAVASNSHGFPNLVYFALNSSLMSLGQLPAISPVRRCTRSLSKQ